MPHHIRGGRNAAGFDWERIDTVLLDLDGTLLDKYFDDYFWESFVPQNYAHKKGIDGESARLKLLATYRKVENTLQWTDLDYWSRQLDLDIPELKHQLRDLIRIRPHVREFLDTLKTMDKEIHLITNAHPKTLEIKLAQVPIRAYFNRIVCSQEMGYAKEELPFWEALTKTLVFAPQKSLFIDDTERVLETAQEFGMGHLVHVASPSSRLTPRHSSRFFSVTSFLELMVKNDATGSQNQ